MSAMFTAALWWTVDRPAQHQTTRGREHTTKHNSNSNCALRALAQLLDVDEYECEDETERGNQFQIQTRLAAFAQASHT